MTDFSHPPYSYSYTLAFGNSYLSMQRGYSYRGNARDVVAFLKIAERSGSFDAARVAFL